MSNVSYDPMIKILKRKSLRYVRDLLEKKLYDALNQPSVIKILWGRIGTSMEFDESRTLKDNLISAYRLHDIEKIANKVCFVPNHRAVFEAFLSPSPKIKDLVTSSDFADLLEASLEEGLDNDLQRREDWYSESEREFFFENWDGDEADAQPAWDRYELSKDFTDGFKEYLDGNDELTIIFDKHIDALTLDADVLGEIALLFDVDVVEDDEKIKRNRTHQSKDRKSYRYGYNVARIDLETACDRIVTKLVEKEISNNGLDASVTLQTKLSFAIAYDASNDYISCERLVKQFSTALNDKLFSKLKLSTTLAYEYGVDIYLSKVLEVESRQIEFSQEETQFVSATDAYVRHKECFLVLLKGSSLKSNDAILDLLPRSGVSFAELRILIDVALSIEVLTRSSKLQIIPSEIISNNTILRKLLNDTFTNVDYENKVALESLRDVTHVVADRKWTIKDRRNKWCVQKIIAEKCDFAQIYVMRNLHLFLDVKGILSSRQSTDLDFEIDCDDVSDLYVLSNSVGFSNDVRSEFDIESFEYASSVLSMLMQNSPTYSLTSNNLIADKTSDGRSAAYILKHQTSRMLSDFKELPFRKNIFIARVPNIGSHFDIKETTFFYKKKELPTAPTRFMNYIGFKNPQNSNFYKDSNYLSYTYLYMYIPQIVNRFQEHLEDDKISQQAPLAMAMNCYISADIADNPLKFLKEALALAKSGCHPLYDPNYSRALVKFSDLMGTDQQEREYHVLFGYLYSLCDYYTRPLAILYNALWARSSDSSVRANPLLREDVRNLASNFDMSKFVESYLECIRASQDEKFVNGSLFKGLTSASATVLDIENELEYFVDNARVWEYDEIYRVSTVLANTDKDELPTVLKYGQDSIEVLNTSWSVENDAPNADVFIDEKGEMKHTRFSKELTYCLVVVSKFWTFTMGPMLTSGFYSGSFWKKFIEGSLPNAVSHIVNISEIFNFAVMSKSLEKIKKDDFVRVAGGGQERLSQTNKVTNLLPYAGIRNALREFNRTPEYSYLGLDGSQPKASRLSLGAFLSIFAWIRHAEKLGRQEVGFGALQTDMGVLKVYQPAFDADEGDEASPYEASARAIRERLEKLSSKFTICIGKSDTYVQDTIDGSLEVFTFIALDGSNLSTMGFYKKNDDAGGVYVYDAKGQVNECPTSIGNGEQQIAMVKWLESLVFKYVVDELDNDLQTFVELRIADDKAADEFEVEIYPLDLYDQDGCIERLFTNHSTFLPSEPKTIEQACGAAQRTTDLLKRALPKEYTQDDLKKAIKALIEVGNFIGCAFFELLFGSQAENYIYGSRPKIQTNKLEDLLRISASIDRSTLENFTPTFRNPNRQ